MKITKYEHACLDIEVDGKRLIIDPGVFTTSVPNFDNITAVVVTHVHPDHLDVEKLKAIYLQNPEVLIYTVQAVADQVKDTVPLTVVTGGHKTTTGPFQLEFAGGQHAVIHKSYPTTDNVGVTVNSKLYYPGDSFSVPHAPTEVLAVPASAPWLKLGEAMDFIVALKPKTVFPTHNAILSDIGTTIHGNMLTSAAAAVAANYITLKPGESITV
jgi:L-ascorbate metabolism protein UlaG (beta-lactamase superfamily)